MSATPPAKTPAPAARARRRRAAPLIAALQALHGALAWLMFLGCGLAALPLLLLLPPLRWRRALVRAVARVTLAVSGMRITASGVPALPHPSVVVANHASYLDGVVLTACLPPDFGFVIKREMNSVPLAAWLLRLIGAEFVERGGRGGTARDALRVMRLAARGHALVFFPEGTFSRKPGLLRFHRGAFAAAARARLPVVPAVIRGTRACLAPGTLLPRAGRIEVRFLAALRPEGASREAAARLRDRARARILAELGEPDLAHPAHGQGGIMPAADPAGAQRG